MIHHFTRRGLLGAGLAAAALPGAAFGQAAGPRLRFSWWGGPQRAARTNEVIALFNRANPAVAIEREISEFNAYWDKLSVQAAGGNEPHLVQMQSRFIDRFAGGGTLRPLDDLVQSGAIRLTGIAESALGTGRQPDGRLYMVPYGAFFFVPMYNRTVIEQHGLPLPREGWTWDNFRDLALGLQPRLPRRVHACFNLGGVTEAFAAFALGHGERPFHEDRLGFSRQTLTAWYQMWEELRRAGAALPADQVAETNRSIIEDSHLALGRVIIDNKAANQLQAHQAVMTRAGSGQLDMESNPRGPAGSGDSIGTNGLSIGARTPPALVAQAAAFIDFWIQSDEAARAFASDNGVVTVDRQQAEQAASADLPRGVVRNIQLYQQISRHASPETYPAYYQQFNLLMQRRYQEVAFGAATIPRAVDSLFTEAAALIARTRR
jgi:multiple sugar transport system substrate-binding protein